MHDAEFIYGCEQLGGYKWGDYDIKKVEDAIEKSINEGINEFDTADCYGLGMSETRLGKIIKNYNREKVRINTKFGVRIDNSGTRYVDNNIKWISTAIDESLKRLSTDYIDLYILHSWDKKTDLNIIFCKLEELIKDGKILKYGISNLNTLDDVIYNKYNINSFSLEFSYVCHENNMYIINHLKKNIRFMPYGVLAQGLLSGKYKSNNFKTNDRRNQSAYRHFHGKKFNDNKKKVSKLLGLSSKLGLSCSVLAVIYAKLFFKNTCPIVGIKNTKQLKDILQIKKYAKSEADLYMLLNDD
jgi:myo-inositol catabolism protein IolS